MAGARPPRQRRNGEHHDPQHFSDAIGYRWRPQRDRTCGYSAGPASAGTNEVTSCRGTTKTQVQNCCDTVVRQHGKPQWMRLSGKNCATAVVCKSGSTIGVAAVAAKVCTIKPVYNGKDNNKTKDGRDPTKR